MFTYLVKKWRVILIVVVERLENFLEDENSSSG